MPNTHNIKAVEVLTEEFKTSPILATIQFKRVSAVGSNELRAKLESSGLTMRVVRNTLAQVAADSSERPKIKELLGGQVAVILAKKDDVVLVAKAVKDVVSYDAETDSGVRLVGALHGDDLFGAKEFSSIASLPSKEALIGMLVFMLSSPVTNLVRDLSDITGRFVRVLNSISEGKNK